MRRMLLTVGLIAFLSTVAFTPQDKKTAPAADTIPRLESLVPAQTMLIVSVPDIEGAIQRFQGTIMGQFFDYLFSKDFRALMTHMGARGEIPDFRTEIDKNLKKELGITWKELQNLFTGEIAFALVDVRTPKKAMDASPVTVDLVLKIGLRNTDRGVKLLQTMIKKEGKVKEFEVAHCKAYTLDVPRGEVAAYWAITPACLILTTQESRLTEVVTAIMDHKAVGDALSSDPDYTLASRTTQQNDSDLMIYFNWDQFLKVQPVQMMLTMQAPHLLKDLGMENVKTMSYASRVKDHKFHDIVFVRTDTQERKGLLKILSTPSTEAKEGLIITGSGDISGLSYFSGISQISIFAAIAIPGLMRSTIAANEKSALANLREMVSTEALWRANDLDRNGVADYWVADMSGMYRIERRGAVAGTPLAELAMQIDVARADGNPFTPAGGVYLPALGAADAVNLLPMIPSVFPVASPPRAKAGYIYEALVFDENGDPYIPAVDVDGQGMNATNKNKFGFVAYPDAHNTTGIHTFIVTETGKIFKADLGMQPTIPFNYSHPGKDSILQPPWSEVD